MTNYRAGARLIGSVGWTRQNIDLSYGRFHTDLVPIKVSYSFTTRTSLQALVQYNNQTSLVSSNIRLALLTVEGPDSSSSTTTGATPARSNPREVLGRSFIVKYTRLIDF